MGGGPDKEVKTSQQDQQSNQTGSTSTASSTQQTGATTGATDVNLPDYLKPFVQGLPGMTAAQVQNLSGDVNNFNVDPGVMHQLQSTVGGDYLYGGPAQQGFVDAAMNAALPGIHSAFRGGRGLSEVALGKAGIDAYAGLYNSERDRQMQAAQMLPQFQMLPLNLKQMLLQSTTSLPQAFSSLYGQRSAGTSDLSSQTHGTSNYSGQTDTTGLTTDTSPLYQPSGLDYALTGVGLLGSFI